MARRSSYDDGDSSDSSLEYRSRSNVSRKRKFSDRKPKESSVPWTEHEMERLLRLVQERLDQQTGSDELVNWGEVAMRLGVRTAKQCREKFRNDLRPDITKAPWTLEEEYILAVAHSQLGNKWSDIAKFLPRRAENTIKNTWYATMRAKADAKTRTFLWIYGSLAGKEADPTNLELARERYNAMAAASPGMYPPLESFEVPEDHFTAGEGARQYALAQQAELGAAPLRSATARAMVQQQQNTSAGGALTTSGLDRAGGAIVRRARTSQDSVGGSVGGAHGVHPAASGAIGVPGAIPYCAEQREHARRAAVAAASGSMGCPPRDLRPVRRSTSPSRTVGSCASGGQLPLDPAMPQGPMPAAMSMPNPMMRNPRMSFDGDASCLVKVPSMGLGGLGGVLGGPMGLPPKAKLHRRTLDNMPCAQAGMSIPVPAPAPWHGPMPTSSHISGGASHNGAPLPRPQQQAMAMPFPGPAHLQQLHSQQQHWRMAPSAAMQVPADEMHEALWAESLAVNTGAADLVTEDLLADFDLGDDEWALMGTLANMSPRGPPPMHSAPMQQHCGLPPAAAHVCYTNPAPHGFYDHHHSGYQVQSRDDMRPKGAVDIKVEPGAYVAGSADPMGDGLDVDIDWAVAMLGMDPLDGGDVLPCSPPHAAVHAPMPCEEDTPVSTARTGHRPAGMVSRYAHAAANPLPFRVHFGGCSAEDARAAGEEVGDYNGSSMVGDMPRLQPVSARDQHGFDFLSDPMAQKLAAHAEAPGMPMGAVVCL